MKKITHAIFGLIILCLTACSFESVEPGTPGRDGRDGLDGLNGADGKEAFVFEYDFDFIAPNYREVLAFPSSFEMLDSDVALVYLLWEVTDGNEIWRLVPQNIFLNEGTLQYNYDFTKNDVAVFLEADFPLSLAPTNFIEGWTARVVVVPGQFSNGRSTKDLIDFSDYQAVIDHYDLKVKSKNIKDLHRNKNKSGTL